MNLIVELLEDEARKEDRARTLERARTLATVGVVAAVGLWAVLLVFGGVMMHRATRTPELDALEQTVARGGRAELAGAVATLSDTDAADRSARHWNALALAQTQLWLAGQESEATVERALEQATGAGLTVAGRSAEVLYAAAQGRPAGSEAPSRASFEAWAEGLRAARDPLDTEAHAAAAAALLAARRRPVGASRLLASLQFSAGHVSDALATLDPLDTEEARLDAALYLAMSGQRAQAPTHGVPGDVQSATLLALQKVQQGQGADARIALSTARQSVQRWDGPALLRILEVSMLAQDDEGLEAWGDAVATTTRGRALVRAADNVLAADSKGALTELGALPADAPAVAALAAAVAVDERRWADAARWVSLARRGRPGRATLDVTAARISTHFIDAAGALPRLEALSASAPWAPGVWTALGEAAAANGRPLAEIRGSFEHALEVEHRPASAAFALAQSSPTSEEALDLLTMASSLAPQSHDYAAALGMELARRGRLTEAEALLRRMARIAPTDASSLAGDGLLMLVQLVVTRSVRDAGEAEGELEIEIELEGDIELWLGRAERLGASASALALERARWALVRGEPATALQLLALSPGEPVPAGWAAVRVAAKARAGDHRAAQREATRLRRRVKGEDLAGLLLAQAADLASVGEKRDAAQLAFRGWSVISRHEPSAATAQLATAAVDRWLALDNTSGARAIAREATLLMPDSPDVWLLRARVQHAAGEDTFACRSLGRARVLHPRSAEGVALEDVCKGQPS